MKYRVQLTESDEDDVLRYELPTEVRDKMWRSLEEGLELLLHEDANKVEQALRVAAQSIRCSRQMVSEYSDRLWRALRHARAKFDEDALSVCALSAMSQVCCILCVHGISTLCTSALFLVHSAPSVSSQFMAGHRARCCGWRRAGR
jgi:hypothetical protein